jgi:hypothetical protein
LPANASKTDPTIEPAIMAIIASVIFDEETNEPAEITSRPSPKLDHKTKKFLPESTLYLLSTGFIPKSVLPSKNFTIISPKSSLRNVQQQLQQEH